MSATLGAVTIGQSPRIDVVPELASLLPGVAFHEAGALDDEPPEALLCLAADPRGPILVTRLRDGREIRVGEEDIVPRVQRAIARIEDRVDAILLLCTGSFPRLAARVPLLYPERLLAHFVAGVFDGGALAVLTPGAAQVDWQLRRWRAACPGAGVAVAAASPYEADWRPGLDTALDALARARPALVVMDCLGYDRAMRAQARERAGVPVVLARSVLARAAAELLGLA